MDQGKSQWVKHNGEWLRELKLLGISYDGHLDTLTAKTRGRVATPLTKGKNPTIFKLETNFNLLNNIVGRVTAKYPELIAKCEQILKVKDISTLYTELSSEFNTIIALMFQGGEYGKTTIKNWEYRYGSLLDKIVSNKNTYLNNELNMINFSSFLFTHLLETLGGQTENLQKFLSLDKKGDLKKLNYK